MTRRWLPTTYIERLGWWALALAGCEAVLVALSGVPHW